MMTISDNLNTGESLSSDDREKSFDEIAQKLNYKNVFFGNVLSHDNFYDDTHIRTYWNKMNILASEMESAGLYMVAARSNKNALTMMTISDNLNTGESLTTMESPLARRR